MNTTCQAKTLAAKILLSILILSPLFQPNQSLAASDTPHTDKAAELLQFTSQGHVLGFGEDGIVIASAQHMLKVDFLGTKGVTPQSDQTVSEDRTDKAQPLDRVTYKDIWDGVTAVYEANGNSIVKSTYHLDGANVKNIRLGYNRPVQLDDQGNLVIGFEQGNLIESAPVAWQVIAGQKHPVHAAFTLNGEHEVGFSLGEFVPGIPVVIDPTLIWNTFLGGSGADVAYSIAVDVNGNVYVAGQTGTTWGTPVRAYTASNDAFVAKLNNSGTLVWNTFLGSSDSDSGTSLAVDGSGNIYVGGTSLTTWGTPVRAFTGSSFDAFAAKLNSSGTLVWNTFLGGTGSDTLGSLAVDGSGNVYVAGQTATTWGSPIRPKSSVADAFAAKLNNSGTLVWNTFLGGTGSDFGRSIAVDGSGNVYVGGQTATTWGTPVRAYTASNDAFVAKLNNSGTLVWNTFLGTTGNDVGYALAVDGSGNVYVGGQSAATWGTPVRAYTASTDAFVAKLNDSGTLVWNTFLGGSGADSGTSLAVDGSGNVYVGGLSPATWGAPAGAYTASSLDAFAAKLNNSGTLFWNTFLGGSGLDIGNALAVDGGGNVYVGGQSDVTWGSPVGAYTASTDAFVALLPDPPVAAPTNTSLITRPPLINLRMVPTSLELVAGSSAVTYAYTVTNQGQVTMTDVTLKDDTCSNVSLLSGDENKNGWLETSETWLYSCSTTLNKTTVNYATVRGLGNDMAAVDTAISQVVVGVAVIPPLIHVLKTPSVFNLPPNGGPVTYHFTLSNPGTVPLANVTLTDNKCGNITLVSGDVNGDAKLQSNETWKYDCTITLTQTTVNTVIVTGEGNGLTAIDTDLVTVYVEGSPLPPLIHIIKKADPSVLPVNGGLVTYTYTVTNPSTVTLDQVIITDDKCGPVFAVSGDLNANAKMETDETWISSCEQYVTETTTNVATATAQANGLTVSNTAVAYVNVSPTFVSPDGVLRRLVKLACVGETDINSPCRTVYYIGRDLLRHVFPNSPTFFTWEQDFSSVETVPLSELSSSLLGRNVTYRPGMRMVKFTTLNKVYAVERNGTLRWIKTEDIARSLYGDNWNTLVDDIPDAFYHDYTFGADIDFANQYNVNGQRESNITFD